MTYEEHLSSTEWNPWLQEKAGRSISGIAAALLDTSSAAATISLRNALYNACKIYVHTVEVETRQDLHDVHARMTDLILEHPDQADALLEATAA